MVKLEPPDLDLPSNPPHLSSQPPCSHYVQSPTHQLPSVSLNVPTTSCANSLNLCPPIPLLLLSQDMLSKVKMEFPDFSVTPQTCSHTLTPTPSHSHAHTSISSHLTPSQGSTAFNPQPHALQNTKDKTVSNNKTANAKMTEKKPENKMLDPEKVIKKTLSQKRRRVKKLCILCQKNPNEVLKILLENFTHEEIIKLYFDSKCRLRKYVCPLVGKGFLKFKVVVADSVSSTDSVTSSIELSGPTTDCATNPNSTDLTTVTSTDPTVNNDTTTSMDVSTQCSMQNEDGPVTRSR